MDAKTLKSAEILISLALAEDVGDGDITTGCLIPYSETRTAVFKAKAEGIVAGLPVAEMVFRKFDVNLQWEIKKPDGCGVKKGDIIVVFKSDFRTLLTAERTALNFLQRMSGIATFAHQCKSVLEGTKTKILDTRKTLPGYRLLDKYAVRMGGASNHRMGLYDMVMIKDNHILVAGGIRNAVNSIRPKIPVSVRVEVETATLDQVKEAVDCGIDIIMLDNMDIQTMKEALKIIGNRAKTEASGNMTPERLSEIAAIGVDYISIGALTHSVKALDISQEIL
jgi:nicotinate-nucleotide pyrophosphorylase (carboxylating)